MAAIAASLMWRGVAKCGSPAPKSTSWAPWARSLAASAVTAMVAETSMRPIRSAKILVAVGAVIPTILAEPCPFTEAPNVGFNNQPSRRPSLNLSRKLPQNLFGGNQVFLGIDTDGIEGGMHHV